jgi:hypothetical protein
MICKNMKYIQNVNRTNRICDLIFFNVIENMIKSHVVVCQLQHVWIKCLMFCKHIHAHFYESQNRSFSNEQILWT